MNTKTVETIVYNIQRMRASHGWNKTKLAEMAGVDPSYISRIEKGNRNIGLESLDKVATAFGIHTHELLQHGRIDELTLREKVSEINSLPTMKKMVVEQLIDAFIREKQMEKNDN